MINPVAAGAIIRKTFIPILFREMAFIRSRGSTISGTIDARDGIIRPIMIPCTRLETMRIHHEPGTSALR